MKGARGELGLARGQCGLVKRGDVVYFPAPMLRSLHLTLLLATTLFFCAGCGLFPKKKQQYAAPKSLFIGTITLVNEPEHFVLIDNGTSPAPASGMVLKTYTGETKSGELLASNLRRHPFLIADIREGAPKKGDRVVYDLPKSQQQPGSPNGPGTPAPGATPAPRQNSSNSLPDKALPPHLPPPSLGLPPSFPDQ